MKLYSFHLTLQTYPLTGYSSIHMLYNESGGSMDHVLSMDPTTASILASKLKALAEKAEEVRESHEKKKLLNGS